jgi:DNA-binding NtrC family response regulator/tetratricopeptide (TPR) repeat protein
LVSSLEASPLSLSQRASGLGDVDALVRDPEARGFVLVQGSAPVLDALMRHVERRVRHAGRPLVKVDGLIADDPWRELSARFPMTIAGDPLLAAQVVADRAGPALVLVREGAPTGFGRAFAGELARLLREGAQRTLVLVLAEGSAESAASVPFAQSQAAARVIEVEAEASNDELALWWEAVARDAAARGVPGLDRLDAIEAWWSAARTTPIDHPRGRPLPLSPEAARLLGRIALSQRSWPASAIARLGRPAVAEELIRAGAMALDANARLVGGPAMAEAMLGIPEPDAEDLDAVAAALETLSDPWAASRASELFAQRGAFDRAEQSAVRAVTSLADATARGDFWRRWERTLAALPEDEAVPRLLRSADLALRTGDVDRALGLGGAALAKRPDTFATLLALGRANVARGDLPTATCWLTKALARGTSAVERAQVEVELAEVRHMDGDIDGARRYAESALAAVSDVLDHDGEPRRGSPNPSGERAAATRLHARNVLGKILLATSAWERAEAHFAADACEAALSGDLMAELRARLNRSIALLSSGRLDEARAMLAAVLAEGEGRGELRAVAYALTNLATIAILKREYAEALRLSEKAFEARRRLGDKVSLALLIANLAELKLRLGQVPEAEQALAFGRKACGPGMPGARASHFAYTAALIHFERRQTGEAAAELKRAFATVQGANDGSRLGECHRLAARIALEDGDLAAAGAAISATAALAETPREKAWVALLEALRARASGEAFGDAAADALEKARAADDPELLREAHVTAHLAAVNAGDTRAARMYLAAAIAVRDQITEGLPEDLRRRYLARRDLADLSRIEAAFEAGRPASVPPAEGDRAPISMVRSEAPRVRIEAAAPALRRMVGRAPAMIALANAIQKVGPSDATVLVHGESGTGKELVAEAIHEASPRKAGPLVKVNCAALVETLLLSELFGHEKGSFTGAAARRRGRFEAAEGGTLFLDEIGDISPRTQVALLRVLQDKTFERVGGVTPIRANVRIVCATHRDLAAMVARGEFREDLYYRLRGVVLEVPALRSRAGDLPAIAAAILERIAQERGGASKRLSPAALEGLGRHAWPGNVRELENALRAAALFAEGDVVDLHDFTSNVASLHGLAAASPVPVAVAPTDGTVDASDVAPMTQPSKSARLSVSMGPQAAPNPGPAEPAQMETSGAVATDVAYAAVRGGVSLSDLKRDIERECIARALAETSGNITRAAGLLGMKRPRLSQLVKQYGFGGGGAAGEIEVESEDGE